MDFYESKWFVKGDTINMMELKVKPDPLTIS